VLSLGDKQNLEVAMSADRLARTMLPIPDRPPGGDGHTQPMVFSADETTDIGYESGTTVTSDYSERDSRFTGKINWVQIDLGKDDHDHLIDLEERLRVAMSRQ
jgi:hypothetical protein